MSKQLFIIAGANGSGKTTLAKELLPEFGLKFINADEVAREINPDDLQAVRIQAGKLVLKKINELLLQGISFAIETTLSGNFLVKTIKQARQQGYNTALIYCFVDNPNICIERIKVRVKRGGHFVPDEDVIRRFYRSKSNLWYKYRDIVDKWMLFYNGIEKIELVASGIKGDYNLLDESSFELFLKDIKND
ncbi:MAG: hypothetical protein A2Y25_10940 [Candidatus Melainabacteria bacterium GWF2_37_15]|nr:MAG: hypothetical protein A2Y25_10940 [Candidatus Melainabacteria bacterium GWF2_37_15]